MALQKVNKKMAGGSAKFVFDDTGALAALLIWVQYDIVDDEDLVDIFDEEGNVIGSKPRLIHTATEARNLYEDLNVGQRTSLATVAIRLKQLAEL